MDVAAMPEREGGQRSPAESSDFDWVNAWAEEGRPSRVVRGPDLQASGEDGPATVHVLQVAFVADAARASLDVDAGSSARIGAGQLARDVVAIERARDALLLEANGPRRSLGLRRTADSVPVILGAVLGVLMLIVFGTAALFVKLAR